MDSDSNPKASNIEKPSIEKSSSFFGVIVSLLLIFAITLVAVAVYLKSAGYDFSSFKIKDAITFIKNNKAKSIVASEISFSQDGSVDCKLYKNYIIVLSKDGIKWYNTNGKLIQENAFTLTKPVIRCSDKYMAVADVSGRDIYFYKDKTLLWSKKMDNQIINANVSDDGCCTVVTQSTEYKSTVQVFDINGVDKYTKLCAEDIVIDAKSIHKGQNVLINKVDTNGVKAGSILEFNDIYEEKPFATIAVTDSILPILISSGENEIAVGQNLILFMDKQGKEVWRKSADSLYCIAPNSKKYIIIAGNFNNASGITKQKILVLNRNGEEVYSFDQPENIAGIHIYGDRIALRTKKSVYLYTLDGKKLGQYSSKNEIKDAYLVGNKDAIVISGGVISFVNIAV
ncbi:hypothetical protein EHE19_017350 [Ruminiclostridium herbifermentans]|uniref:Outer membrane protein assembly factor BamB n=1 Tax=Ruminiclostridium herbifermentans TaxID=2488810 RepID=A0A4U7JHU3_9FIRM|nr:DUF5711 family protein [Ruminiclostridium herbifermentans]QNU66593.1 hypothetical protein EHE19_017350 [Ruminiclostridium herbifermentans]